MDEKYLQDLYNWTASQDPSFTDRYTFDSWKNKIGSDSSYQQQFYDWVSSVDDTFSSRRPYNEWSSLVKKKDESVQAGEEVVSMESPTVQGQAIPIQSATNADDEFSRSQASITPQLIEEDEEFVVPKLKFEYEPYGFSFEEKGLGDYMEVKAYNGETMSVALDPFFGIGSEEEAAALKDFLKKNKVQPINPVTPKFRTDEEVVNTVKSFNKETNEFVSRYNGLKSKMSQLEHEFALDFGGMTQQQIAANPNKVELYNQWVEKANAIKDEVRTIEDGRIGFEQKGRDLDRMAGEYAEMQSKQGGAIGGFVNAFLTGSARTTAGAVGDAVDLVTYFAPNVGGNEDQYKKALVAAAERKGYPVPEDPESMSREELVEFYGGDTNDLNWMGKRGYQSSKSSEPTMYDELHSEVLNRARRDIKYGEDRFRNPFSNVAASTDTSEGMVDIIREALPKTWGDSSTTTAWADMKKQSFWGGALLGVTESLPAMMGNFAQRTAQMYAQVSDHLMEEMDNNPEFDNISESEKRLVQLPIAITSGVLESAGVRNVLNRGGLINGIVARALGKSTSSTSAKTFAEFVQQDISSMMGRGLLTVGAAGAAEFETGFSQQLAETSMKTVYNSVKDKEMFQTPDSIWEYFKDAMYAGAQEAVGGFVIGAPTAVSAAVRGQSLPALDNRVFEMFEEMSKDENYISMYRVRQKQRVIDGEITAKEAKEEEAIFNRVRSITDTDMSEYTTEQKKEIVGLLYQKQLVEERKSRKTKELRKSDQKIIDEIDERIAEIDENRDSATDIESLYDETMLDEEAVTDEEPMTPSDPFGVRIFGESVSNPDMTIPSIEQRMLEEGEPENEEERKAWRNKLRVIDRAYSAIHTLKSFMPNVDIVLHENTDSHRQALDWMGKRSAKAGGGTFIFKKGDDGKYSGRIDIDLSTANKRTVTHEVAHAVLLHAFANNQKTLADFQNKLSRIVDRSTSKKLKQFVANYDQSLTAEEYLAELTGYLADADASLDTNLLQDIALMINELVSKLTGGKITLFDDLADAVEIGKFFKQVSDGIRVGEDLSDVKSFRDLESTDNEQGASGEVGQVDVRNSISYREAPLVENDPRSWYRDLVKNIDLRELQGRKFITNMYDFTAAGMISLSNGIQVELMGGSAYTAYMMHLNNKGIRDVSNLAAFNSKANAEGFIRNVSMGEASLFAPHSGTKEESWQFQHHIFSTLVDVVTQEGLLSNSELIKVFNSALSSQDMKAQFDKFRNKLGSKIRGFNEFKSDPMELVDLLGIEKNMAPNIRKALNAKLASNKKIQSALGVKNALDFATLLEDPSNKGIQSGDIMSVIEFDPSTMTVEKTSKSSKDHHPSFGWTIKAKINGIYQPTKFIQSTDITDSYTKYNLNGTSTVYKKDTTPKEYDSSNVSSSAGSIPKVAVFDNTEIRNQLVAPNGKPSNLNETQYNQVRTPEFKRWFGDWENDPTNASKAVDENGEPLVVYHGSRGFYDGKNKQLEDKDITQFSSERLIFTTDNIDVAKYFGDFKQYFVNIKNPFIIDDGYNIWERLDEDYLIKKIGKQKFIEIINQEYGQSFTYDEWLKYVNEVEALPISIDAVSVYIKENKYYDGVIAFDIQETTNHIESNDFICFNPNEIKLADGTNTTFDPSTADIRYQVVDDMSNRLKEVSELPPNPPNTKDNYGSITSGKVHLYHSTNGLKNLEDIEKNGIDFSRQKALDGVFFSKLNSPYRRGDSFVVIETDVENIPWNQRQEGQEVALGQLSDYKIVHSSRLTPEEKRSAEVMDKILRRSGVEGYREALDNYKRYNKGTELTRVLEDILESQGSGTDIRYQLPSKSDIFVKKARAQGYSNKQIADIMIKRGLDPEEVKELVEKMTDASKVNIPLTEDWLTGYDRVMSIVPNIIAKVKERTQNLPDGVDMERMATDVENYVRGAYLNIDATDQQREQLVRDALKLAGVKTKSSPSTARILGKPKPKKAVTNEMTALKDQIRLEARAAMQAKVDQDNKRKTIAEAISVMLSGLRDDLAITKKKFDAIQNKLARTNLNNPIAVERLISYVESVANNADHVARMAEATKLRTKVKKLSKRSKYKDAFMLDIAKVFAKIDPSLIEDVDAYIAEAKKIVDGLSSTVSSDKGLKMASPFDVYAMEEYVDQTILEQNENVSEAMAESLMNAMGIDGTGMSIEEMMSLLASDGLTKEEKTKLEQVVSQIKSTNIKEAFDVLSAMVSSIISSGTDPFTGEEVEMTADEVKLMKWLTEADILVFNNVDQVRVIDALNNFLVNQSVSGVGALVQKEIGIQNAKKLADSGKVARLLKFAWSPLLGRIQHEQLVQLPLMLERYFGATGARRVMNLSGLSEVIKGKATATKMVNVMLIQYVDQFGKRKPNQESFNSEVNVHERGAIAFMGRALMENDTAEFERRKKLMEQSIEALMGGSVSQIDLAVKYQETYDALIRDANSIEDVYAAADPINIEAVQFWRDAWAEQYPALAAINLQVYNETLNKDINYIPDTHKRVQISDDVDFDEGSSFRRSSDNVDKSKSGTLTKATRPKNLTVDSRGDFSMYISLDFDFNNANRMQSALVDIHTANAVMKLDGFLNSKSFKKVMPVAEDRELVSRRIKSYVRKMKGNSVDAYAEDKAAFKKFIDYIGTMGVARALGAINQGAKQTIPVAFNTMVNADGRLDLSIITSKEIRDFIANSGMPIANRSAASQASLDFLDELIERAADSNTEKVLAKVKSINRFWLKNFLQTPDVFIAQASFVTYYNQNLRKRGIEVDYSNPDQEALDYAQYQVDRQQNTSDHDLQGEFFTSNTTTSSLIRKVVFPFANFALNQKARMYADLTELTSKTGTREDKVAAIKSLAGLSVEMAMFYAMGAMIRYGIMKAAYFALGFEEDDEDRLKRLEKEKRMAMTNIVRDVFSPVPVTDDAISIIGNAVIGLLEEEGEEEWLRMYEPFYRGELAEIGIFGIQFQRFLETGEQALMAKNGTFSETSPYGEKTTYEVPEHLRAMMGGMAAISLLSNTGILPQDFDMAARYITKKVKKESK